MNPLLWRLGALTGLCLLLAGCAQIGPPLPPSLELPVPPTDLRATRKGNSVTLYWSEPTRTTDRQSVRYLGPTRICRSQAEEMKECGTPVGTVDAPSQPPAPSGPVMAQTFTDTLPATVEGTPSGIVTYGVEVLNRDGRSAGLSNGVKVEAVATLPPPTDLAVELSGDGVTLSWSSPGEASNVPEVQHRWRIYRREEGSDKDVVAGEVPAGDASSNHFLDSSFAWEKAYLYRVAPVSTVKRATGETQAEGDDSATVRIVAHDVFPPAVPTGLQAVASGEGQKPFVDLIWAPVTTADLAGYNVYRNEDGGAATKLNAELVRSPAYRDSAAASGKNYTYSVSAVDVWGNESARSEAASETVP